MMILKADYCARESFDYLTVAVGEEIQGVIWASPDENEMHPASEKKCEMDNVGGALYDCCAKILKIEENENCRVALLSSNGNQFLVFGPRDPEDILAPFPPGSFVSFFAEFHITGSDWVEEHEYMNGAIPEVTPTTYTVTAISRRQTIFRKGEHRDMPDIHQEKCNSVDFVPPNEEEVVHHLIKLA